MDTEREDAVSVVKDYLRRLGNRTPTREEVAEIAPALDAIYWRLMRGQRSARSLDLSRYVWDLLEGPGGGGQHRPHPPGDGGPRPVSSALPRPTGTTG